MKAYEAVRPEQNANEHNHSPSPGPAPAAAPLVARAGCLRLALAGYFGAWVWHRVAGLNVTGVDLAEYVKFLPPYRAGQLRLLRESFYVPLAAGSLIAGLIASRRVLPLWLRWVGGLLASRWRSPCSPRRGARALMLPEFRLQTVVMAGCIAALLLLLVTRFFPDAIVLLADRAARARRSDLAGFQLSATAAAHRGAL